MPFAYFSRLSKRQQGIYLASDRIERIVLSQASALSPLLGKLEHRLAAGERRQTETLGRQLVDGMVAQLAVPAVTLKVLSRRPHDDWGELHGLYESSEDDERALITVWMRTAKRKQVVAFRSFLRTILHEFCHHLDYELLKLADSFHTQGFYKRESSLFHQLTKPPTASAND